MKPAGEVWSAPARAPGDVWGRRVCWPPCFAAIGGQQSCRRARPQQMKRKPADSDNRRQSESLHPPEAYGQYARQCRQRSDLCMKLKGRYSKAQIQGGVSGRDPEWAGRRLERRRQHARRYVYSIERQGV